MGRAALVIARSYHERAELLLELALAQSTVRGRARRIDGLDIYVDGVGWRSYQGITLIASPVSSASATATAAGNQYFLDGTTLHYGTGVVATDIDAAAGYHGGSGQSFGNMVNFVVGTTPCVPAVCA